MIFITHNVHHAYPIGDSFTLFNRGRSMGTYTKDIISKNEVLDMMTDRRRISLSDACVWASRHRCSRASAMIT